MQAGQPRRAQSSMDVNRPPIDPTIRGIPQGWDDDPLVSVAGESPARPPHPSPNPQIPLRNRVKLANFANRRRADGQGTMRRDGNTNQRPPIVQDKPLSFGAAAHRNESTPKLGTTAHVDKREGLRKNGQKCTWGDCVYKVGYEKNVLDTEARLHETMLDLVGSHTSAKFNTVPSRVLDIGTGLGLWPIAQSRIWPDTEFVGLDRVPCQLDLARLRKRRKVGNIRWVQADFLEPLPYPDGHFDHVHLRFIALGVPEPKWPLLLEECCRVLKRRGRLEIIETSYDMPLTPTSFQASFASLLIANSIADVPAHAIDFALPMLDCLVPISLKAVYRQNLKNPPGALQDAAAAWISSALDYKSSFKYSDGTLGQTAKRLNWRNGSGANVESVHPASLWIWVVEKV